LLARLRAKSSDDLLDADGYENPDASCQLTLPGRDSMTLAQLCPTLGPHAACRRFCAAQFQLQWKSPTYCPCPYFDILEFDIFDAVVLSVILSGLLPLQSGFERFE